MLSASATICFGYEYDAWAFGSAETGSGIGFRRHVTTFYTYPDTTPNLPVADHSMKLFGVLCIEPQYAGALLVYVDEKCHEWDT